ncbi:unnamed protein product [Bursaphelenchus okinawaensis]|uniref:Uncharacterized protein n=1 Tax=Bursaphelenchus okinawaensis TaxID=465554 RepID=A0A811K503_9BILA|nr:unnamed protein product [Bursaphelenchus okinawaensis]CAG9091350.1 unnamed protein product [Bursaphelenchus okinawaensis]
MFSKSTTSTNTNFSLCHSTSTLQPSNLFKVLILSMILPLSTAFVHDYPTEYYHQVAADPSDPCHFPVPDLQDLPAMCRYEYHQVPFICDPTAMLSRTEAQLLEKMFDDVAVSGCLNCQRSPRGCISDTTTDLRVSVIIVPMSNVQKIELCVLGRSLNTHIGKPEALNAYVDFVYRRWSESSCTADLTILYLKTLETPLRNGGITVSGPMVVRLFRNRLAELSHLQNVRHVTTDHTLLEVLSSELNQSFALAKAQERFQAYGNKRSKSFGGVPLWAYGICGGLLALVVVTLYFGNCITKRLNLKAQQKKSMNNRNQNQTNAQQATNDRWRAGFGGGLISQGGASVQNNNPSAMSNMGVNNTKSSMMFRQFSNANAKKQRAKAAALVQKI